MVNKEPRESYYAYIMRKYREEDEKAKNNE